MRIVIKINVDKLMFTKQSPRCNTLVEAISRFELVPWQTEKWINDLPNVSNDHGTGNHIVEQFVFSIIRR